MEALVFLVLIVIAFVAIAKATAARRSVEDFETRLRGLETELQMLRRTPGESATEQPFAVEMETEEAEPRLTPAILKPSQIQPTSVPPPLPPEVITAATSVPSPAPSQPPAAEPPAPKPSLPAIDWEQFMGAKLFAWIGGLALFLGVAFFVKYSFEHDLIPPELRVAIGFPFCVLRIDSDLPVDDADHSGGVPARRASGCDHGGHSRNGRRFS